MMLDCRTCVAYLNCSRVPAWRCVQGQRYVESKRIYLCKPPTHHPEESMGKKPQNPLPSSADKRQVGGNHYKAKAIQPWDAMRVWMSPEEFAGYLRGNVIKYTARCNDKNGVEDLRKAHHYLEKLIEFMDEQK